MLSNARIVLQGQSAYAHEQEALRFMREVLPDHDPYHVWELVELLDPSTGRLLEIDALVLGYSALYVIEIKSGPRPRLADAAHLRTFRSEYGPDARAGLLLHTGSTLEWLAPDILAAPWWRVL